MSTMLLSFQGEIMDPKVSVITVCYNAEEFIEHAITSVLAQTYTNIEYLIIDGNSNDNTVSIINKYKDKIHYFISESDNGMYDAMNKGIKNASGDIFFFLNSDDVFYDKHVVENVVKTFQLNEDVELIYGPIIRTNPITNETFIKTHENISRSFLVHNAICQQGMFYKADCFKKVGIFDDTYKIVGDFEWTLRAFYKLKIKRKYYPQITVKFRDGGMGGSDKFSEPHKKERQKVLTIYYTKFELYIYWFMRLIKKFTRRLKQLVTMH